MTPSDDLYQLITSLSPSEKRYFRLYASLHARESSQSLELFDLLNQMKEFDQDELLRKIRSPKLKANLSMRKNYLHHLVLRSMRNYHGEKHLRTQAIGLLQDCIFLYQKSLYRQSAKVIRKARRMATEIEYFPLLVEIETWEKRIRKKINSPKAPKTSSAAASLQHLANWTIEIEWASIYDQYQRQVEAGKSQTASWDAFLPDIAHKATPTFRSRHFQLMALGLQARLYRQNESLLRTFQQLVDWWESHPMIRAEEQHTFRLVLGNLLGAAYLTQRIELIPKLLTRLKNQMPQIPHHKAQTQQTLLVYELLLAIHGKDEPRGTKICREIRQWRKQNTRFLTPKLEFPLVFNCLVFSLGIRKVTDALDWVGELLDKCSEGKSKATQFFLRCIQIVLLFEAAQFDASENKLRSLGRWMGKISQLSKWKPFFRELEFHLVKQVDRTPEESYCILLALLESTGNKIGATPLPGFREIQLILSWRCRPENYITAHNRRGA